MLEDVTQSCIDLKQLEPAWLDCSFFCFVFCLCPFSKWTDKYQPAIWDKKKKLHVIYNINNVPAIHDGLNEAFLIVILVDFQHILLS